MARTACAKALGAGVCSLHSGNKEGESGRSDQNKGGIGRGGVWGGRRGGVVVGLPGR